MASCRRWIPVGPAAPLQVMSCRRWIPVVPDAQIQMKICHRWIPLVLASHTRMTSCFHLPMITICVRYPCVANYDQLALMVSSSHRSCRQEHGAAALYRYFVEI